jgi:hypothetical protein
VKVEGIRNAVADAWMWIGGGLINRENEGVSFSIVFG